ncbi:hypothetical protein GQN26_24655 [Escherichia coli]|nr:hypothetical protein [Escherichia coli]MWP60212.1 hypothetical protein [Escherichia coli]MXF54641.1 hypothetical protein [Escherichia coli]MXF73916.1 hypothetical protein [Escherichia coli]MXH28946.1 hypothetical protein [Escherichia coli]
MNGRGGNAAPVKETRTCTVKEIIRDVLDTDVPDSECVFAVVLTRGDVRHMAQDWNLSDDELETVMQRLDDAFVYGAYFHERRSLNNGVFQGSCRLM